MEDERAQPMPAGLRLERVTSADEVVVVIHGEIDIASAGRVRDEVVHAASSKQPSVTVDFRDVSFIDSSGLSALVEARDLVAGASSLRLRGVGGHLRRLLEISGLITEFEIIDG
jgi:anti-sigma B factor antagonist